MLGPLVWGPLSEIVGRRPVFIGTFIVYVGFQIGCALAPNTGALLAFRFLGGTFAAAPLTKSVLSLTYTRVSNSCMVYDADDGVVLELYWRIFGTETTEVKQ